MASNRTTPGQFSIGTLSIVATTMHRLAAALLMFSCFLFLATHAQQQPQPATSGNTASPSCLPHERDALLAFMHGIISDPAGLLDSWRPHGGQREEDCCRWRGVRCSNLTGHVHKLRLRGSYEGGGMEGKISPSLLALKHLEHLDLSWNKLVEPTGGIPKFLGSLKSLTYLNLSGIPFDGVVPPQLGNLTGLQYLDLSRTGVPITNSMDLSWLTHLPSIKYLNLDEVDLSQLVDWPHVMNMVPSLRALHLSDCFLASANQSLPHLNLTNLEELDASMNYFNHPMVTSWFRNMTSLKYLYLSDTDMYGRFPDALGDITSLQVLDLSMYGFIDYDENDDEKNMRVLTADLKNLCNLEVLNLKHSLLHGDVTQLFKNLPRCSPNNLQELNLGLNQLTGILPRWIGQLTSLVTLDLGGNNISGSVPTSVGQFTGLQTLDLSWNNLNGNVPSEIGMLGNLISLVLNNNKLDGVITEEHFVSARSLQCVDLSYNALKIEISSYWQSPFRLLDTAYFAACQMGPLFPGWLQWHTSITHLDISSAGIADRLPQWFSDAFSNVKFMNISYNQLNGSLPANMGFMPLQKLYLSSNLLTGHIPTLPPNISILDLSNNFLSGPLPPISGCDNLADLSLFSNQITGHISESFCKCQQLNVLDLSNNFLEGELPSCLGVMENVQFLCLSNNSLSGGFPSFVQNLTDVVFIDLAMNKFSGRLPTWIGELRRLTMLRLSHNKFSGNIPVNITNLACLRYLDLSNNEISGSLPSYLSNLKAMRNGSMGNTYDIDGCSVSDSVPDPRHPIIDIMFFSIPWTKILHSLSTILKGQELDYGSIDRVLDTSMMWIDLSSNNLTGEIPEEIVVLDVLVNLNLSRNHFSGVVPKKIGKMQSLESLDLSRNMLSGEIPATLSNLTFLGYMDLSYNNLTGRIPSGRQLDTLYAEYPSMYIGNIGLCVNPLQNNCSSENHAPERGGLGRTEEGRGIQFFYLGLGCGFVVGTWMAFGVLLFKRSWRIACFRLLDKLCDKVYVLIVVWARKTGTDHHA